jgi:hypothetical protein
MLVVAGCSSDSDGDKKSGSTSSGAPDSPAATKPAAVAAAKFTKLPGSCKTISAKTIAQLVPETKVKAGTVGKSSDLANRTSCSWNGLDDNGVKGSQYRWLDVSFLRYDSEQALGVSAEQRAEESYDKEIAKAKASEGAKKVRTSPAAGVGEAATAVGYDLTKTGEDFVYATVVTRTGNVVITLTYNGTGYAGAKAPVSADLMKGAVTAAKEAVASVAAANP